MPNETAAASKVAKAQSGSRQVEREKFIEMNMKESMIATRTSCQREVDRETRHKEKLIEINLIKAI